MVSSSTPPGWYDDGSGAQRWWDGAGWADRTQAPARSSSPSFSAQYGDRYGHPLTPPEPVVVAAAPVASVPPVPSVRLQPDPEPEPEESAQAEGPAYPVGSTGHGDGPQVRRGRLLPLLAAAAVVLLVGVAAAVLLLRGGGALDTAEDYVQAQVGLDYERVCELTAADAQQVAFETSDVASCRDLAREASGFLDEQLDTYYDDVDIEVEVDLVSEDDEAAEVGYTVTSDYTGDDPDGYRDAFDTEVLRETASGTLLLVVEDGDWRVSSDSLD